MTRVSCAGGAAKRRNGGLGGCPWGRRDPRSSPTQHGQRLSAPISRYASANRGSRARATKAVASARNRALGGRTIEAERGWVSCIGLCFELGRPFFYVASLMAPSQTLVEPRRIRPNPENPRLIFHADELQALEDSIKLQGILVPLTVYEHGDRYVLLDGERRWRCAVKLGLPRVPVVVQAEPDRLQNIMMMFAIHNARTDWDPLPTAYKLQELQEEFAKRQGRTPTEKELAELASITRGEVRRLRQLLSLPDRYRDVLMEELDKPRSQQVLTVDHVLEATKGAAALRNREIIGTDEEEELRQALVDKFRNRIETNTVEPRQLMRIARAVDREQVSIKTARRVTRRLIREPRFTIANAFAGSVEQIDYQHGSEQLAARLDARLKEQLDRRYPLEDELRAALERLRTTIGQALKR
jgi:ParB family transcriptional regulator, chromosome partitioning protein